MAEGVGSQISGLFKGEHAVAGLYTGILAAALGEILPDPSDALYFYLDRKWRVQLELGEISPKEYWRRRELSYFGLDFLWWMFILLLAVSIPGDFKRKSVIVFGVVGTGAVIGIIAQNIRQDKEFWEKYKLVKR